VGGFEAEAQRPKHWCNPQPSRGARKVQRLGLALEQGGIMYRIEGDGFVRPDPAVLGHELLLAVDSHGGLARWTRTVDTPHRHGEVVAVEAHQKCPRRRQWLFDC
jgi:hypothetical protein